MLTLTLSVLVVLALGSLVLIRSVKSAPVGFENTEGFHFGNEACGQAAPRAIAPAALRRTQRRTVQPGFLQPASC
ncbi:MAG: hypothetical protein JNN01_27245 [Opitutaceae bacterium]|nr:hypothetical protein [Opitutaceae bacterium]